MIKLTATQDLPPMNGDYNQKIEELLLEKTFFESIEENPLTTQKQLITIRSAIAEDGIPYHNIQFFITSRYVLNQDTWVSDGNITLNLSQTIRAYKQYIILVKLGEVKAKIERGEMTWTRFEKRNQST